MALLNSHAAQEHHHLWHVAAGILSVPIPAVCACSVNVVCCLEQEEDLKKAGKLQGGVLTPASAMGMLLVDRLNNAGLIFKVEKCSPAAAASEE